MFKKLFNSIKELINAPLTGEAEILTQEASASAPDPIWDNPEALEAMYRLDQMKAGLRLLQGSKARARESRMNRDAKWRQRRAFRKNYMASIRAEISTFLKENHA